ncbi:MAG: PIN domain nuclease [Dissulfuribacterales bacterium]
MANKAFLIDTSAWICALRKDGHSKVRSRVAHLLEKEQILICGMIKLELLGGTRSEHEYSRLQSRLNALTEIPIHSDVWKSASRTAFNLRRVGLTIPATDILIAGTALYVQAALVHVDRHFDMIAGHIDLQVESFV